MDRADRLFKKFIVTSSPNLLADVYELTYQELWVLSIQLTRNRYHAEDLLQNTYLAAIESKLQWDHEVPLIEWMTSLLAGIHDERTQVEPVQEEFTKAEEASPESSGPLSHAIASELDKHLEEALQKMEPHYQEVLRLKIYEGLNSQQIGDRLGRSGGTVRSQLKRAIEKLRGWLPGSLTLGAWLPTSTPSPNALGKARESAPIQTTTSGSLGGSKALTALWFLVPALLIFQVLSLRNKTADDHAVTALESDKPIGSSTAPVDLVPSKDTIRLSQTQSSDASSGLSLPMVTISGRLTDAQGRGLKGIKAALFSAQPWHSKHSTSIIFELSQTRGWVQHSDSEGRFSFHVPVPEASNPILDILSNSRYTGTRIWFGTSTSGTWPLVEGRQDLPTIRMEVAYELHAIVLDGDGNPVEGVLVSTQSALDPGSDSKAYTDAHGRAHLKSIPEGKHNITVTKGGIREEQAPIFFAQKTSLPEQLFRFPDYTHCTVKVLTAAGDPIEGARVWFIDPDNEDKRVRSRKLTDPAGQLSEIVATGKPIRIVVTPRGWLPGAVELTPTADPSIIPIRLSEAPVRSFRLLDAQDQSTPRFATVLIRHSNEASKLEGKTFAPPKPDTEGLWHVQAYQGDQVQVQSPGYLAYSAKLGSGDLVARDREYTVQLTPTVTFKGRIVRDGQPVAKALIEACTGPNARDEPVDWTLHSTSDPQLSPAFIRRTRTNADGYFSLRHSGDPRAQLQILCDGREHGQLQIYYPQAGVAQRTIDLGELELQTPAKLQGTVILPTGFKGLGITLSLNSQASAFRTVLDEHHKFSFASLPPGEHTLIIETTSELLGCGLQRRIKLDPSEANHIQIDMRQWVRTWPALILNDTKGIPIANCLVALAPNEFTGEHPLPEWILGESDELGRLSGCSVGVGPKQLWLRYPADSSWQLAQRNAMTTSLEAQDTLELIVSRD